MVAHDHKRIQNHTDRSPPSNTQASNAYAEPFALNTRLTQTLEKRRLRLIRPEDIPSLVAAVQHVAHPVFHLQSDWPRHTSNTPPPRPLGNYKA